MANNKRTVEGRTLIYAEDCCFVWKIENFSVCFHQPYTKICSPLFKTGSMSSTAWSMELHPVGYRKQYIGLFLRQTTNDKSDYYAVGSFSVLNNWGQKDFIFPFQHLFNERHRLLGAYSFADKILLERYKFNLMKDDILTLICDVKVTRTEDDMYLAITNSPQLNPFVDLPHSSPDSLSKDLLELYSSQLHSDLILKVGDESLQVHKAILCARSPVFTTMLSYDMKEKLNSCIVISDFDPQVVKLMVSFMYSGKLDCTDPEVVMQLYHASVMYGLQDLRKVCAKLMVSSLSVSTVVDMLRLGEMYQDEELTKNGEIFFQTNSSKVLENSKWQSLCDEKPILASNLLKNIIFRQKRPNTEVQKVPTSYKKRKL